MPTLQELRSQKAALDRQISDSMKASRAEAITQIRTIMSAHGLSVTDLAASAKSSVGARAGSRAKVAAKYRHPESGATWSGRGFKPKWLTAQLANGKQVSDFAI